MSSTIHVRIDDINVSGDSERVKAMVEAYIAAKVADGGGAIVNDASPEAWQWLRDLTPKYPPNVRWTGLQPGDPVSIEINGDIKINGTTVAGDSISAAGSQGWIRHDGGECPVGPKDRVHFRTQFNLDNPNVLVSEDADGREADTLRWVNRDDVEPWNDNIVVYKVIGKS